MGIRCGNHKGLPIYHETADDVRFCFANGPVVEFDPTDRGVRTPIAGTKMESEVERYKRNQASLADGQRAASRMSAGAETYARSRPDYDTRDREGGAEPGEVERRIAASAPGGYRGGSRRAASEPMVKYVYNLARYKSMDEDIRAEAERRVEAHRRDDEPEPMAFDFAKRFIDAYKDAAQRTKITKATAPYASPERVTQDGMYRDPATGAIYKVQWNRANGDARHLYAKQLYVDMPNGETRTVGLLDGSKVEGASARFEYVSGLLAKIKPEWRMALEEAEKFGALYGICMRCGRDLTLEESIARAMGRICAGKANWS